MRPIILLRFCAFQRSLFLAALEAIKPNPGVDQVISINAPCGAHRCKLPMAYKAMKNRHNALTPNVRLIVTVFVSEMTLQNPLREGGRPSIWTLACA